MLKTKGKNEFKSDKQVGLCKKLKKFQKRFSTKNKIVDTTHIQMFLNQIRDVFSNLGIVLGMTSKMKTRHTSELQ